jgi:hypothetical protein
MGASRHPPLHNVLRIEVTLDKFHERCRGSILKCVLVAGRVSRCQRTLNVFMLNGIQVRRFHPDWNLQAGIHERIHPDLHARAVLYRMQTGKSQM